MNRSTPGLPVHHRLPEFTQTHVHWVGDAIEPSRPLSSPSPPAFNLSKHQGLFQGVISSHQTILVFWMLSFKPAFSLSSFTLFFFCLQSFQASGSFPISQLFTLGVQSIGDSGSASVLPKSYMGLISFKVDWFSTPWCPRDSQESSTEPQLENISSSALCLLYCLSSSYMCTWLLERV